MCNCGCAGAANGCGSRNFREAGANMDWTDFFQGITTAGTSIATTVIGPRLPSAIPGSPGAVYIPSAASGSIISTNTGISSLLGTGSSGTLLLILLAFVLIFALKS